MPTHTRTHVYITFADPYLTCDECAQFVTGFHDNDRCGCDDGHYLRPCDHNAGATSACPSWSPVDGCECLSGFGRVDHAQPPEVSE